MIMSVIDEKKSFIISATLDPELPTGHFFPACRPYQTN
jgi:hypothetical protein